MTSNALAASLLATLESLSDGLVAVPGAVIGRWLLALRVRRERRALLALSDRTLKDIGLSRSAAYREGGRSFFDLPDQQVFDRRRRG